MSTQINDGGPAFPHPDHTVRGQVGMSLRDYFAAAALPMVFGKAQCKDSQSEIVAKAAAGVCYEIADAMLEARKTP